MKNDIQEACVEVLEIIKYMEKDLRKKIPKEFINDLNEYKSKDYSFTYDRTKKLNEQNIKKETKGYIAYIYKYYLCNEKEAATYNERCKKYYYKLECEKKEKYKDLDIFKDSKEKNEKLLKYAEENRNALIKLDNNEKNILNQIFSKVKVFIRGGKNGTK